MTLITFRELNKMHGSTVVSALASGAGDPVLDFHAVGVGIYWV